MSGQKRGFIVLASHLASAGFIQTRRRLREFAKSLSIGRSECVFLLDHKVGDTTLACALGRGFKARHPDLRFSVLTSSRYAELVTSFDTVDRVVVSDSIPPDTDLDLGSLIRPEPRGGELIVPLNLYRLNVFSQTGRTIVQYWQHAVDSDQSLTPDMTVKVPEAVRAQVKDKFAAIGIEPGHGVLLAPHADSMGPVDPAIWDSISRLAGQRGYRTFTNVHGPELPVVESMPLSLPLLHTVAAAEYLGHAVAIRNGLCDLLSFSAASLAILYPSKPMTLMRQATLRRHYAVTWRARVGNVFELDLARSAADTAASEVMRFFAS
jgi:hypothetical protein